MDDSVADQETEKRIFEAARAVFHEQGYNGARMQEIAKRAGINQSMLHYYYRTKDRLFEEVFHLSAREVMVPVLETFQTALPFRDKIERFVHLYIDSVVRNPHVPGFILEELRRNPDRLQQFVGGQTQGVFAKIEAEVNLAVARGDISPTEPMHFITNLLALCVFPFIARPMLQTVTGQTDEDYKRFLVSRKQEVVQFIFNALSP